MKVTDHVFHSEGKAFRLYFSATPEEDAAHKKCTGCAFSKGNEACAESEKVASCWDGDAYGVWKLEVTVPSGTKPTNPKTAAGDKKVPLWLCSPIAEAHWALAQFAGMCKYQAWNWRIAGVRSSTYLSAMRRHIAAYESGEEFDPVDGTHHLGNIMACAAILLDARAAGKLNDDRPPSVGLRETYAFVEGEMAKLRERYAHIEQKPFTIKDPVTPDES